MNLFYQVFDKGIMRDGEGREINFRNTIIIMTSNLASETIVELCGAKRPRRTRPLWTPSGRSFPRIFSRPFSGVARSSPSSRSVKRSCAGSWR